jgi:cytochrome P450
MAVTDAGDALLDPYDPELQQDPFPTYRRLREHHPVLRMPDGSVVVSRHPDVVALLKSEFGELGPGGRRGRRPGGEPGRAQPGRDDRLRPAGAHPPS